MASNPKPRDAVLNIDAYGTPMQTNASGPKLSDPLEMNGRVTGIGIHQSEATIRDLLYVSRQCAIVIPKIRRRKMIQSFVLFPSL